MKKFIKTLAIMGLIILGCLQNAHASHYMGGEITWKQLAKDSYEVEMILYRDCNGTSTSTSSLTWIGGSATGTFNVNIQTSAIKEITPTCGRGPCTRCNPSKPNTNNPNPSCTFAYGIEAIPFKGIFVPGPYPPRYAMFT